MRRRRGSIIFRTFSTNSNSAASSDLSMDKVTRRNTKRGGEGGGKGKGTGEEGGGREEEEEKEKEEEEEKE